MEKSLGVRLQAGVKAWTEALRGEAKEIDLSMDTDAPTKPTHKLGGDPKVSFTFIFNVMYIYIVIVFIYLF